MSDESKKSPTAQDEKPQTCKRCNHSFASWKTWDEIEFGCELDSTIVFQIYYYSIPHLCEIGTGNKITNHWCKQFTPANPDSESE